MNQYFKIILFGLVLTWTLSCGKNQDDCTDSTDPNCSNYDACWDAVETSAEFGFYSRVPYGSGKVFWAESIDTFYIPRFGGGIIHFKGRPGMDEYTWQVGTDPRTFEDSIVTLIFEDFEGPINVTLTVKQNEPRIDCFPSDTGEASLSQAIYIKLTDSPDEYPITGTFIGNFDDKTGNQDTVIINPPEWRGFIFNVPEGCYINDINGAAPAFIMDSSFSFNCGRPTGTGRIQPDFKTIIIEYSITNEAGDPEEHIFVGQRQ
jgi:hypothetical protein